LHSNGQAYKADRQRVFLQITPTMPQDLSRCRQRHFGVIKAAEASAGDFDVRPNAAARVRVNLKGTETGAGDARRCIVARGA